MPPRQARGLLRTAAVVCTSRGSCYERAVLTDDSGARAVLLSLWFSRAIKVLDLPQSQSFLPCTRRRLAQLRELTRLLWRVQALLRRQASLTRG